MRYLIGLLIIVIGLGLLLENTGAAQSGTIIDLAWPAFIIGVGLLSYVSNRRTWFGPAVIVLIGLAFLLSNLDVLAGEWANYFWPALLVLIGLRVVIGREIKPKTVAGRAENNVSVFFSGLDKKVTGKFEGCNLNAVFGGVKLDLRDADIQDNAEISTFTAFGGAEIFVSKNVSIKSSVLPIFGGASDKTQPEAGAIKSIRLTGTALFGGTDIKN